MEFFPGREDFFSALAWVLEARVEHVNAENDDLVFGGAPGLRIYEAQQRLGGGDAHAKSARELFIGTDAFQQQGEHLELSGRESECFTELIELFGRELHAH